MSRGTRGTTHRETCRWFRCHTRCMRRVRGSSFVDPSVGAARCGAPRRGYHNIGGSHSTDHRACGTTEVAMAWLRATEGCPPPRCPLGALHARLTPATPSRVPAHPDATGGTGHTPPRWVCATNHSCKLDGPTLNAGGNLFKPRTARDAIDVATDRDALASQCLQSENTRV